MDFSKFKTPDWLMIGGGIGIFVFGFFEWVTVSGFGFSSSGGNVFDFFWTGTIPWILVIASAVVTFLLVQGTLKQDQLPWPLVLRQPRRWPRSSCSSGSSSTRSTARI